MIILAAILTGVSAWFEWQLLHSDIPGISNFIRWFYQNKTRRLLSSIAMSAFIGSLFGAAGMICLVAGITSTFVIQPIYKAEAKGVFRQAKLKRQARQAEIDRRLRQIGKVIGFFWAPVAFFARIAGWCLDRIPERAA